eukprot:1883100-Amphidinium_carterae.2
MASLILRPNAIMQPQSESATEDQSHFGLECSLPIALAASKPSEKPSSVTMYTWTPPDSVITFDVVRPLQRCRRLKFWVDDGLSSSVSCWKDCSTTLLPPQCWNNGASRTLMSAGTCSQPHSEHAERNSRTATLRGQRSSFKNFLGKLSVVYEVSIRSTNCHSTFKRASVAL